MQCPKCKYTRQPNDRAPEYECPQCGVIYAKYNPNIAAELKSKLAAKKEPSSLQKALKTKFGKSALYTILSVSAIAFIFRFISETAGILVLLAAFSAWVIKKAIEGSRLEAEKREREFNELPYQHCLTCGNDFKYRGKALRGSNTMEVALWILILWPIALIYSIWRRLGVGKSQVKCLVCASTQVVPADSPAAVSHKRTLSGN